MARQRIEVDDTCNRMLDTNLFGTGGAEMDQRVLSRVRKDFQVGSEDWNDVTFTRQRIRWIQDSQSGSFIEVRQQKAIEELEEIPVERNTNEDLHSTPAMHTATNSPDVFLNFLHTEGESPSHKHIDSGCRFWRGGEHQSRKGCKRSKRSNKAAKQAASQVSVGFL